MNKKKIVSLSILCCLALAGTALAQTSPSYGQSWHVVAGGGGQAGSASYVMQSTAGQPVIGSSSMNYRLGSGYWQGAESLGAGCAPPSAGDWNVNSRIECNDVRINLNGNLNINAPDGNLSFNNVTLLMNVTEMGQYSINVNGGKFYINSRNGVSSNITNGQNKSVYYTFKVRYGSTFQMRNSILSAAGTGLILPDFSNNGLWIDADNVVLDNNTISRNHFDGVYLNRSSNSRIINNRIFSNDWDGIDGANAGSINVTGNEIYSNGWTGIALGSSANVNISFNRVHDNSYDGISISSAQSAAVKNNTVLSNHHDGIVLSSAQNANVSNNTVNNSGNGIIIGSSPGSTVFRNSVNKNWRGVYVSSSDNVWLDNNTVFNNTWYGLHLYYSNYNNITGNKVNLTRGEWDSAAMYLSNSSRSRIDKNIVYDNWYGIVLWYSPYATITTNTVLSNSNSGIQLQFSGNSAITQNNYAKSNDVGIAVKSSNFVDINDNTAINGNSGISLESSDYGGIKGNNASNNGNGISLSGSSHHYSIANNTARNNNYGISLSWSSINNTVTNNSAESNNFGLYVVWYSNSNNISNNRFRSSPNYGGYVFKSNDNNISYNNLSSSGMGLHIEESHRNILLLNNVTRSNNYGIDLYNSNNNSISNNNAKYSSNVGIGLSSSNGNNITNNTAENNSRGISLQWSGSNTILNNSAQGDNIGIFLYQSNGNNATGNKASSDSNGIELSTSNNNNISSNTVTGNSNYGIHAYSSNSNNVTNNTVLNNGVGVYLDWSTNNMVNLNRVESSKLNGIALSYWSNNNKVRDNTVNSNGNISIKVSSSDGNEIENNSARLSNIGIFMDWSKNNVIKRNNASNNDIHGISLEWFSDSNEIKNNSASDSIVGLSLMWSSNNRVENNTLTGNNVSTNLEWSSNNNILRNNKMSSNNYGATVAWSSDNNTFTGNRIESNARIGMYLRESNDNVIYNNRIANPDNAYDNGVNNWNIAKTPGTNIIGGSFLGGNYWNDYAGVDTDGDGLGDTMLPYNSGGNISTGGDNHPLVVPGSEPPLYVSVTEDPDPVGSGGNSLVTVHVTTLGSLPVSGANVYVFATGGTLTPVNGTSDANGDFRPTYTAPAVAGSAVYTISATAVKAGYTNGSASDTITVSINNTVSIEDVTSPLASEQRVPIVIYNSTGVASASVRLSYNASVVLAYSDPVLDNGSFTSFYAPDNSHNASGYITINTYSMAAMASGIKPFALTGNPVIGYVRLRAVGSGGASSALDLSDIVLTDDNSTEVLYAVRNGTFVIVSDGTPPVVTNANANQSDIPDDTDNDPRWGETARLNVTVIDANSVTVTVNLSEIGGAAAKQMTSIGGGIWSTTTNASAGTTPKIYNLTVNATDSFGNSNTSVRIPLRVRMNGDTTGDGRRNIGDALRLANNVSYPGDVRYFLSSIYVAELTGEASRNINIGDALRLANNVSYPGDTRYILK